MPASEYGSYYWCVVLKGGEENASGEAIHLHADGVEIDDTGTLKFTSAGRRPAGAEPGQPDEKSKDNGQSQPLDTSEKKNKNEDKNGEEKQGMVYVAFAPGSWKLMYAAKLRDGTPASIEHWTAADGNPGVAPVTADAGAAGFGARE